MTYLFITLAILAFLGFFIASVRRNGHRMVYSAVLCIVWIAAAAWWSDVL